MWINFQGLIPTSYNDKIKLVLRQVAKPLIYSTPSRGNENSQYQQTRQGGHIELVKTRNLFSTYILFRQRLRGGNATVNDFALWSTGLLGKVPFPTIEMVNPANFGKNSYTHIFVLFQG
jgi:hypothetical protein